MASLGVHVANELMLAAPSWRNKVKARVTLSLGLFVVSGSVGAPPGEAIGQP